jgi:hypothetical protein
MRVNVAVVDLRHDRQHRDFEHDRVQPRPLDRDVDLAVPPGERAHVDEALVELEQPEQVDEIALHEPPAPHVVELASGEAQAAQSRDLAPDLADVRLQVDTAVAALEAVLDLGRGKVVQHDLHHRELVQVGVEQRRDDHEAAGSRGHAGHERIRRSYRVGKKR